MKQALPLLRFLRDAAQRGEHVALVTLTDVTGSAARAIGEHMAVAERGASVGSFSGGCVEAAVIAEAQDVIAASQPRLVRFGAGSRYIDIRLPCGGGIDLLFSPDPDIEQINRAIALLEARRPVVVRLPSAGTITVEEAGPNDRTGWVDGVFHIRHDPMLRLVVLGHGAEPLALLGIASAYGAETLLLSPQTSLVEAARKLGMEASQLRTLGRSDRLAADPWTAVVTLFHDHDWEPGLLLQALELQPFFIGAMGSRKTHQERRCRLLAAGGDHRGIDRIVGPIGLIYATRDPQTLAISIMAQVVQAYEEALASRMSGNDHEFSPRMTNAHRLAEYDAATHRNSKALHQVSDKVADMKNCPLTTG